MTALAVGLSSGFNFFSTCRPEGLARARAGTLPLSLWCPSVLLNIYFCADWLISVKAKTIIYVFFKPALPPGGSVGWASSNAPKGSRFDSLVRSCTGGGRSLSVPQAIKTFSSED